MTSPKAPSRSGLRQRILFSVGALVLLSLLGSTYSLFRITAVNQSLDSINRVSVPLGRLLEQLKTDTEILKRESARRLGYANWKDPQWKPQPLPTWISDLLQHEVERAENLIQRSGKTAPEAWSSQGGRSDWQEWVLQLRSEFQNVQTHAQELYEALSAKDLEKASTLYPRWVSTLQRWDRRVKWGVTESERNLGQLFSETESQVAGMRTGLQAILIVVVFLSLMLLWLGERALRPLGDLTQLARQIAERGLRKEDKTELPSVPVTRTDEVSQLAREFRNMATTVLEREKTVELQKQHLEEKNKQLRELSAFNQNVLNSIESVIIVTDLEGLITQMNPRAVEWLGGDQSGVAIQDLGPVKELKLKVPATHQRIEPQKLAGGRIYAGHVMPLHFEDQESRGAIFVLEDVTEEQDLEKRLRMAEHLAAVGRMSAQVAHEVRNPLHAIGLEAEMALERAQDPGLKQSAQSILAAVERLEKITENYLKLSKPSSGEKKQIDLSEVLETTLATYTPLCEETGATINWTRESNANFRIHGDEGLIEQVLGNLLKNSLQAVEAQSKKEILFRLGNTEDGRVWMQIEDSGPGVSQDIMDRLFDPFVTTKAQGTGLGLAFIKQVLDHHGGKISLEAPKQLAGACFQVSFPGIKAKYERRTQEVSHSLSG